MDRTDAIQLLSAGDTQTGTTAMGTNAPEQITAAAYQDDQGNVTTGANHPEILKRLGISGYDTAESRNTPRFGFQTDRRNFITREAAGPVATASGQNLKTFEPGEPVHSDEVAQPGTKTPIGDGPAGGGGLAPKSAQALQDLVRSTQEGPLVRAERLRREKYIERNKELGVPLDIETGASPWEKFVLGFHREKDTQVQYLQNKYGEQNVRTDEQGGLIVRVLDSQTGKAKDLKVDEWNMTAKDLLELAGSVPEVAAGVIATLRGRQLPRVGALRGILGLQRDIAATALGAETAGAVKDIGASVATKGPSGVEDVPKIAKERAQMAVGDVALGEVTMGAARALNFMKAPLASSRGRVQFDAIAAQKYFKDKYGVYVPLTIGESTGSPIASRTEAFYEELPGGGTPFKEFRAQQEDALRQLQTIMMGKTPPTEEALGRDAMKAIMDKIAPTQEAVATSQKVLGKVGTHQIENIFASATAPERQAYQSQVGKEIRDSVIAKRDAAKAEADRLFEAVRAAPGGTGKVFEGEGLQNRFKTILDNLPSVETKTEVPTGIVGPAGEQILRTEEGKEVLKEYVPPNVLSRLRSVTSLEEPKFSLQDLQQMRREVYDDIAKGEGVPGLGTHYLNDIGKAITGAIDDEIANMPSGKLRSALDAANKHYKEKVVPFNRQGLTELFRGDMDPGYVSDSEVISRVFSGGEKADLRYKLMKDTLGESSPEFANLKRSMADRLIASSRLPGDSLIDPKKLVQNLTKLRTDNAEIADDMFGGKINEMFRQAKFLEYAKGAKIDAAELQQLLKNKTPTAKAFQQLITDEATRDRLYSNQILKDVANGSLADKPLNPTEFVNRFLSSASPTDTKQVMYMLRNNQPLTEDIRAKTVESLFRDAARQATPVDLGKLMSGDPTRIVTGTSVFRQMEAPQMREKLRSILGPDVFNDLNQYILLEGARQEKARAFKSAGGIAAGMQIANMTRKGPLTYLYDAGKDWIAAKLLTSTPMRAWLSSVPSSLDPGAVSLLLSSPPFLEAVAKDFPGVKGAAFINAVKDSVDRWTQKQKQGPQRQPDAEDLRLQRKRQNAEQLLTQ